MVPETQFEECCRQIALAEFRLLDEPTSSTVGGNYHTLLGVGPPAVRMHMPTTPGIRVTCRNEGQPVITLDASAVSSPMLVSHVSTLTRAADFIKVYERRYKEAQLEAHREFRASLKEMQLERFRVYSESIAHVAAKAGPNDVATKSTPQPETTRDKLLATNRKITSNLVRTNHVLQSSVLQSELNISELHVQTDSLHRLNDRFDALSGVLDTSSKMIKIIQNSSSREKRNIYSSLAFLILCVSWVLWRRVFKTPVKILLWLWFRFFRAVLVGLGAVPGRGRPVDPFEATSYAEALLSSTTSLTATISSSALATVSDTVSNTISNVTTTPLSDGSVEHAVDRVFSRLLDEL